MNTLLNRRIILGVTGGIAAYKSAELLRRLRERGAEVEVVMTHSACEFITPLTMQALSGKPVRTELMDANAEAAMGHIELARWADVVMIAPASANFMAKLSHGQADDLLSTLCLATTAPILLAPAMNRNMWLNPATQDNQTLLQKRGIRICGPAEGDQACGDVGPGRMLEPDHLVNTLNNIFSSALLAGTQILVTAGPTREPIDPVRFISNRSSGRMGYAVARAAVEAGARVTLVTGPTELTPPEDTRLFSVFTARQMFDAVMQEISGQNIFISVAAVADYSCRQGSDQKLKKTNDTLSLELTRTSDILKSVASLPNAPFTVGFAAETEQPGDYARKKLISKNLDMIAANQVGEHLGFESDENAIQLFWKDGERDLGHASKDKLARLLIQVVAERYYAKNSIQTH